MSGYERPSGGGRRADARAGDVPALGRAESSSGPAPARSRGAEEELPTGPDAGSDGYERDHEADVVVVGAGPAGSSAAFWLAQAGLDVVVLEKDTFPREKVCGDGLTPRAVRALLTMGVDTAPEAGWMHTRGLRVVAGDARVEVDWPDLVAFPSYGLVRARRDLDALLARRAVEAGAWLRQGTAVVGPVLDERSGRVVGVTARPRGPGADRGGDVVLRAPVVLAADGVASRLSLGAGLRRRTDRPLGVAVRSYYATPRHDEEYLEAWLGLDRDRGWRLPGYGWVFGMGDGTANVGVVALHRPGMSPHVDYRALLTSWLTSMPPECGLADERRTAPVHGAGLPLGFNRTPHYVPGLMLVGDAGGMVNPFTGEGIAYALESGRIAADVVVQALGRRRAAERERVLAAYPAVVADAYGAYFAWGRGFVKLINHPSVMAAAARHGLSRPAAVRLAFALATNLTDPRGDAGDRIIHALTRLAPSR